MKRILLFAATVIAACFCSQSLWAEEREYTDAQYNVNYTYDTDGNTAKVKSGDYNNYTPGSPNVKSDIVILDKFIVDGKEYTVNEIGTFAFVNSKQLKSVVIPATITQLGICPFFQASNIEEVTLECTTPPLSGDAIYHPDLFGSTNTIIYVADDIEVITSYMKQYRAVAGYFRMKGIERKEYVDPSTNIIYTYYEGAKIARLKDGYKVNDNGYRSSGSPLASGRVEIIPEFTINGVTYIVTDIGNEALSINYDLTELTIPSTISYIGSSAFTHYALKKLNMLGSTPPELFYDVFYSDEYSQIEFSVPEGSEDAYRQSQFWSEFFNNIIYNGINYRVRSWEDRTLDVTYNSDRSLSVINFPSSIEKNGETFTIVGVDCDALHNYDNITSITISETMTEVYAGENNPFTLCKNLRTLKTASGNPRYDSRENCNAIIESETNRLVIGCSNSIIPESVTAIGRDAFYGAVFESITIPAAVKSIGDITFGHCNNLKQIIIKGEYPFQLESTVFEESDHNLFDTVHLIVPKGAKSRFEAADVWKNFKYIEEGTEGQVCEVTLGINDVEPLSDGTFNVPVELANEVPITAFQMDIKADEGATVEGVTLGDRAAADHSVSAKKLADGTLRVLVYSRTTQPFAGNNGTLLNIQVSVQSGTEHLVSLTNIEVTGTDGTEYTLFDVSNTFTSFFMGDANCDGRVTISDVTAIINHILGDTPTPFNALAADVNQNGKISVTDVVQLIDRYLFDPEVSPSRAESRRVENEGVSMVVLANPTIINDHSVSVDVMLSEDAKNITAFQFDVVVPDDVTLATDGLRLSGFSNHEVIARMMSNGVLRVVCYSVQNDVLAEETNVLLTATFDIEEPETEKTYSIGMANVELATSKAEPIFSKDMSLDFVFDNGTVAVAGIYSQSIGNPRIYNLNGQRYAGGNATKKTVLIKDGKKYFK